jgi:hypothetical protein
MHLLLFLKASANFNTLKQVNEVVYIKIPDLLWDLIGEL